MMNAKDLAAMLAQETREKQEIQRTTVRVTRHSLAQAFNMAADVMQNSAAVAKSAEWQGHYRQSMKDYRDAANAIALGAKFAIKG